ncbi:DNA-binding transcriptional MerR regulator [Saccharopolyspora erythraea NRRL 2338]|uniref:MerR-family transcriptional regulator n=2 Tax=Saccharopolyspora erythraea TaxID=1836 RepID=A4FNB6_SACEN|nr:MerR family transcriptional regulator [Saccharopolyspora erythraea]EQD87097.1 MerR family transcriptional regulator [Saccharopolyspora erythraea D]PFG99180.1 DNA-binding transcriptional MerR regulator [Saccharopolyspora erythraea NRRL 2338]QRK89129.1 MerR family transcriptional regulator [Saccharopolyspora erythraea]CAM05541.1 MerR-family transcriptional regulator [Saccharopolyspora erythraea NRRL 2338]
MLRTADEELTIDELAARAGVTVRTVRFYSSRGLLPPPRLRGRLGLYGGDHLARLDLIRDLQALGFTLSAIERHLERIPADATPEDLALQRALLAPWTRDQSEDLDRHELNQRAGRHLDDELIEQLVALGVLERLPEDPDRLRLPSTAMLGVGLQILDLGLPLEMLVQAKGIVEQHTTQIAVELRELFAANVLRPYVERGRPEQERERVRAATDQLRPLTIQVLVNGFQRAVNDVIRDHV